MISWYEQLAINDSNQKDANYLLVALAVQPLLGLPGQADHLLIRPPLADLHVVHHDVLLVPELANQGREGELREEVLLLTWRLLQTNRHHSTSNEYIISFDQRHELFNYQGVKANSESHD